MAIGLKAGVRRDPMAMLPFTGYNMADYFHHWLDMRRKVSHLPRFFHVSWFRKDADAKFLWPGYGENMRVLEWIVNRCHGRIPGHETQIGWTPDWEDFHTEDLANFDEAKFDQCMIADVIRLCSNCFQHRHPFLRECYEHRRYHAGFLADPELPIGRHSAPRQ